MIVMLVASGEAHGWECLTNYNSGCDTTCEWAPGNSLTYNILADEVTYSNVAFESWQLDSIEEAAAAWRAGASQRMRGASWEFVRGVDDTWVNTAIRETQS